jgi:hypothetical protein
MQNRFSNTLKECEFGKECGGYSEHKKSSNSVATSVGKLVDTAGEHDREKSEAEGSKT